MGFGDHCRNLVSCKDMAQLSNFDSHCRGPQHPYAVEVGCPQGEVRFGRVLPFVAAKRQECAYAVTAKMART